MFDMFGDLERFFQRTNYWFDRPVKDQQPYSIKAAKQGYIITVNTLGIAREDLSINLSKPKGVSDRYQQLNIYGTTKIEKINFENKINLQLLLKFERKIEALNYECRDGLTLIYLKLEPEKIEENQVIEGKLVDSTDPFDFD